MKIEITDHEKGKAVQAAARVRIENDKRLGRVTPQSVFDLLQMTPEEIATRWGQSPATFGRRPSEDETWMNVAEAISNRSKCTTGVGAVIVAADGRIQATGYNGPPASFAPAQGMNSCRDFCPRQSAKEKSSDYAECPSLHAEWNALLFSDESRRKNGTMYITKTPCMACAKAIANSGLFRVVFPHEATRPHRNTVDSVAFLRASGLEVEEI